MQDPIGHSHCSQGCQGYEGFCSQGKFSSLTSPSSFATEVAITKLIISEKKNIHRESNMYSVRGIKDKKLPTHNANLYS